MSEPRDPEIRFDHDRAARTGLPEAVFAEGKSTAQLVRLIDDAVAAGAPRLFTRLAPDAHAALPPARRDVLDHDPISRTAWVGPVPAGAQPPRVAVVAAGSADVPVAREAERTLAFHGEPCTFVADVGVAGLWRLLERRDEIATHPVVIAVAGMEGALFSVLGGLVPSLIVAVPTSVGYGVAAAGDLALRAALSSCAPGIVACNIDNGYGAACAAVRALGLLDR